MKKSLFCGLLLAGVTTLSAAPTLFTQFFNNNNGSFTDSTDSLYNWEVAFGATGTADAANTTLNNVSAGNVLNSSDPLQPGEEARGRGFLFALDTVSAPGAVMLFTNHTGHSDVAQNNPQPDWFRNGTDVATLAGVTLEQIVKLQALTQPGSNLTDQGVSPQMRLAIQVGSTWYVSNTVFQQNDNPVPWEAKSLANPAAELWLDSGFVLNTSLDLDLSDQTPQVLPAGSTVSGFGLYADTGDLIAGAARVRLDSFSVEVVPEPATVALLAGSLALLWGVRRRK